MNDQLAVPPRLDPASQQARSAILRNLLLHEKLSRREIGQIVSRSGGSVTRHTQWLIDREMIHARKKRVPTSFRPVEELSLVRQGTVLALGLSSSVITAQLAECDGGLRHQWDEPVLQATQACVFEALDRAVSQAYEFTDTIDVAGLGVVGYLIPDQGLIFGVEGIEGGWEPCQPGRILPSFKKVGRLFTWTDVACKARGLAGRLRNDGHLVFIEYLGKSFRIADIEAGEIHLGRYGTTSSRLHQSVVPDGPLCYCGRRGCLANYIQAGECSEELLADSLFHLLEEMKVDAVGVEWAGGAASLSDRLQAQGVAEVHAVSDGQRLCSEGLRALTIEKAFGLTLEKAIG